MFYICQTERLSFEKIFKKIKKKKKKEVYTIDKGIDVDTFSRFTENFPLSALFNKSRFFFPSFHNNFLFLYIMIRIFNY